MWPFWMMTTYTMMVGIAVLMDGAIKNSAEAVYGQVVCKSTDGTRGRGESRKGRG